MTKVSLLLMFRALILILIATLMGCGKPPPETLAAEYLEYMDAKKDQGLQFAMAGPDVRSRGKMWENIVWNKYKHSTPGFVWGHGGTIEKIEKLTIESCEERIGKNDCYIYYRNNTYVRIAERKKWLANNPAARKLIKKEQAEQLAKEKLAAQQAASRPVTNTNTSNQPDYDKAQALFNIANQALQSTLPQQNNSITCNTLLNPMGGTTTCR